MVESLENVVNNEHGDVYYANKEIIIGNIGAGIGGFVFGLGFSYLTDSKEYLAVLGTIGNALGFQAGYILCTYKDRRKNYTKSKEFWKYLLKFEAVVNTIGGVFGHTTHTGGIYLMQHWNIAPWWAALIAHLPAILIGTVASNVAGYLTGVIKYREYIQRQK